MLPLGDTTMTPSVSSWHCHLATLGSASTGKEGWRGLILASKSKRGPYYTVTVRRSHVWPADRLAHLSASMSRNYGQWKTTVTQFGRTVNSPDLSRMKVWVTHQARNQDQLQRLLRAKGILKGQWKKVVIKTNCDYMTSCRNKDCDRWAFLP